ncbi:MAG: endopeptidase La [Chloroflexi bacterium]|nr:endopeptidase La [Chloroflexota bacterium]
MANRKSPNNELPEEIGAEQSQPQDEQNPQAEEAIELNAGAVDIEQEQTVDLNVESEEGPQPQVDIPDELPILPLRGMVVYPQTTIPLTVGQPRSIRLVDEAVAGDRVIGLVASKDPELETPGPDDIYEYGTLAQIHRLFRAPDGTIRLLVQGIARIQVEEYTATEPYLKARVSPAPETVEESLEVEALMRNVVEQFGRMADLVPSIPSELINAALSVDDPLQLVYALATYIRLDLKNQQDLLRLDSVLEKLRALMNILNKELEVLELGHKIQTEAQSEMEKMQREFFLREQLKAIQRELGEGDEQAVEVEEFRRKIEEAHMSEEAEREARRELERLARLPTAAAEYGVIRTYLDWLTSLPWDDRTDDNIDIRRARQVLDEDHYGLQDIKERILEYLAVRKLRAERADQLDGQEVVHDYVRREREGVILCFVGPPGVGKTSLGASIARATNRRFTRLSLGGVRDEAEIRGFRRTYIGAMPGRIIQTLRRVETRNPVIMLDEVDKLGRDFRGDPASALLEVLDPEQNHEFRDHYLDVPFDLSEVMFITTANTLETIPVPLLDRMEIIQLSGYTEMEKVQIAQHYLVPRQIRENGLLPGELAFTDEALLEIIRNYTREAGVRNLEREIGRVARKMVTRIAEGREAGVTVDRDDIVDLLDHPRFGYQTEIEKRTSNTPGVAIGLSVTAFGGDVLFVEAAQMPGSKGFQYTGQLGQVMQESARAAFSYIRSKARDLGLRDDYFEQRDIHLHVPAGAVPKDGPSAGVTMATALASLFTGRPVHSNIAMTGEITLRGQVLPVGGIKDKVLAAHRAQLDTVILPRRNEPDLDELPDDVRESMTFILVDNVTDTLEAALAPAEEAVETAVAEDALETAQQSVSAGES